MGQKSLRKLKLLLWKNITLQLRRPIGTVVEFVLPIGFLAILLIPRYDIDTTETCAARFQRNDLRRYVHTGLSMNQTKLAYFPINSFTTRIMNTSVQNFNRNPRSFLELVRSSVDGTPFATLDEVLTDATNFSDLYAGVITFNESAASRSIVNYSIRLHESRDWEKFFNTKIVYPSYISPGYSSGDIIYLWYYEIFIVLQHYIDSAIIQWKSNNKNSTAAQFVHKFPVSEYLNNEMYTMYLKTTSPLLFVLAFIYTATMIVKELVTEKQHRLKESMKMMGLANWIHWTAWFIKSLLFFLLIILLQTILLTLGGILQYTGMLVIFITLLMYVLATICSLFLLSVFFFNGTRGMLVTTILWLATYAPSTTLNKPGAYESLSIHEKYALCLLPNTCLSLMMNIITKYETAQRSLTLIHVDVPVNNQQDFLLTDAYIMLIIDSALFLLLTWYIENIYPGEYGIPKPLCFPFRSSYWCGEKGELSPNYDYVESKNFEAEPIGLEVGISINHLRKEFHSATGMKVAVDDVNVNIFKGQITALLGHNGAGKTTTLSMLTGLFPPTAGSASINGRSILTDMDAIRDSFGICPQHNVLFDRLTVKEHLEFFSALKGVSKEDGAEEITQLIEDMQLVEKTNEKVFSLSGGMKRKLCCAIALVGGSETVFLDEPTSGMDPYARRATWDVLQRYRENKTIILTTHFMDEADYLGDRIAIMVNGHVYCCGSSLYLKKQYGVGYHLTLVKSPSFDAEKTFALVEQHVPTAKRVGNVAAEVSYILDEESTGKFQNLFEQLEVGFDVYGITNFGISVTTMEEVFLKVGEQAAAEERMVNAHSNREAENLLEEETINGHTSEGIRSSSLISAVDRYNLVAGIQLKVSQFYAMFVKRLLNSKRKKTAVLTQLLVPLVLLLLGILLIRSLQRNFFEDKNSPPRELVLSMLKTRGSDIAAQYSNRKFFSPNKMIHKEMADAYYHSIGVTPHDITEHLYNITVGNQGDRVSVLYSNTTPYTGNISISRHACCHYQYLVLNPRCGSDESLKRFCRAENRTCFPVNVEQKVLPDTSMDEYILENRRNEKLQFYDRDVAGFTVDEQDAVTVWYSGQGYHTLPSAFSAVSNIILKSVTNDINSSIITINHPLPIPPPKDDSSGQKRQKAIEFLIGMVLVIFTTMSSCLLAGSFIPFLVTEKVTQAKHVQFVSGVNSFCYWGGTFCWDIINFSIPGTGFLILFAAFDLDGFRGVLQYVLLMIILYGISMLPFVYLLSFLFTGPIAAYAFISSLVMILSIAAYLAAKFVSITHPHTGDVMHHVFLLFPTYAFPKALDDLWVNNIFPQVDRFSLKQPGIGLHMVYMCATALFYFLLLILIEENVFASLFPPKKIPVASVVDADAEDEDVTKERRRVHEMPLSSDTALLLKDLTKVYRTNGIMAVDHLNLQIPKGECFGLLGINGAGKTTTFGMLTGELRMTEGSAYLHGIDIRKHLKKVQQMMGYCPQFDGLVGTLTGREMLRMFARLRGVPSDKVEKVVRNSITSLNLYQWADKLCGTYSGGNKRKLSTALALVGKPSVIFLDEPTSGMDPGARRHLWNALTNVLEAGRSIVLTSHSMEECEALCTKLVIMVNGKFKCVGSLQHLKSRFGQGYVVMLKIDVPASTLQRSRLQQQEMDPMEKVKEFMSRTFSGADIMEERQGFLQYHIESSSTRLSEMFGIFEGHAKSLNIVDYSVSQTTLDQIFVMFAKEQHSEERVKKRVCFSCMCF